MANIDNFTLNGVQYTIVDSTVGTQISAATAGFFDGAYYDSNTKRINFYNGTQGNVKAFVDATPFLVDGMIDSVSIQSVVTSYVIKDGETGESPLTPAQYAELPAADKEKYDAVSEQCLVITWNTDAGKQTVNIPLSQIFDPDNYYTKNETDTLLGGKQATLVSGTNIKTVNNQSLLGSGNIAIESQTITVDSELSTVSENPVQNKVITTALNNKANSSSLANVATSGAYSDLSGTPFIPTITYDSATNALVINTVAQS